MTNIAALAETIRTLGSWRANGRTRANLFWLCELQTL